MLAIGIDPGLSGGIFIYDANNVAKAHGFAMPVKASHRQGKKEVDAEELAHILSKYLSSGPRFFVEQVSSRPGQAAQFQFGVNYGVVLGVIGALGYIPTLVPPNVWKAAYSLKRSQDETLTQWKSRSIVLAEKLFPNYTFGKKDGIAEACLIAYYGAHATES